MKVSLVTTCRNREHTIAESVFCVARQTYPDIEHIVVDAASTDRTVDVVRKCRSARVTHLLSEPDSGVYQGLNKGVKLAQGDVIGWVHSDDCLYDDRVIEDVVRVFETTGCDVVYGNGIFVDEKHRNWVIRDWVSGSFSRKKMFNGWLPLHTAVFVCREVFDEFGYFREDYQIASDTDWLLRIMLRTTLHVEYLNRYLVIMCNGGLSTSLSKTWLKWREDLGCYYRHGINPRVALIKKVTRKIPQFIIAPFKQIPSSYFRLHRFSKLEKEKL